MFCYKVLSGKQNINTIRRNDRGQGEIHIRQRRLENTQKHQKRYFFPEKKRFQSRSLKYPKTTNYPLVQFQNVKVSDLSSRSTT